MIKKIIKVGVPIVIVVFIVTLVCILSPIVKNNKYEFGIDQFEFGDNLVAQSVFRQLGDYKESPQYYFNSTLNLANEYTNNKEYSIALNELAKIKNHKGIPEKIADINNTLTYDDAINQYEIGNFEKATLLFKQNENYKDSDNYLEKLELLTQIQGGWGFGSLTYAGYFIDGWDLMNVNSGLARDYEKFGGVVRSINKYYIQDNCIIEKNSDGSNATTLEIQGADILVCKSSHDNSVFEYNKGTLKIDTRVAPAIGMTADEALNSKWGRPEDINKTTNRYGVSEQWCYSSNRYVYLDDGIVTSIQQ